ncbi:MAG: hypothetical protein A3J83_00805 [Elusimicrobia bacterium RIFOXYA2_FULL_40_6]|nr:MAG: hypothetical protein A3J83_00805 [Elusimicrobia bacterium RIFOXYA2_FULL_40_6]
MNVLVFNCGSSSLTFKVYEQGSSEIFLVVLSGKAHRVGVKGSESSFVEYNYRGNISKDVVNIPNHRKAANLVLKFVKENNIEIDCIGHRFVHGGQYFQKTSMLGKEELKKLEACIPLAPIHNPISLAVIDESTAFYPDLPQYVTFDSAFHSTIPEHAFTYALPKNIINKFGFRKYGFHGLSYSYVSKEVSYYLGVSKEKLKIIACHLGTGGSSVVAIKNGKSIDTSMGYSPLPGLMMSTRSGDVDPMLSIYLMAMYAYKSDEIMDLFNKKSGLLGVSGFSSDIRDIIKDFGEKENAQLAFDMYVHRLKKYIGSYVMSLGGLDALIFTDDIGVKNWLLREKVCENMQWCGISLNKETNKNANIQELTLISAENSKTKVVSIPTDEEKSILHEGIKLMKGRVK